MLGNYNASQKVIAHEEKKEMSNISKGSGDMTLSNSSSADDKVNDENERIRKGLMLTIKAVENVDREFEEQMENRRKETMIYFRNSILY